MAPTATGVPRSAWLPDDLDVIRTAESLGYDTLWASEGQGKTAFGKLERWATVTDSVRLATGIVNIYSRTPAALAQAVATLDEHSGGRAMLGLGTAHPGVVEAFHGVEFDRPLARLAEYIELVRRYLAGVAEPYDGEVFSIDRTSFWEAFEPREDVSIYNAAFGPANVRLTGELADGWLPNILPLDAVEEAIDLLETGAERAGRSLDDIDVAMYVPAAVAEDPAEARYAAAHHVVRYWHGEIPGYYDRVAREAGYGADIDAIQATDTREAAAEAVSDELLDLVAVAGTPDEVRSQLAAVIDAGIEHPVLRPVGDEAMVTRTLETLAP